VYVTGAAFRFEVPGRGCGRRGTNFKSAALARDGKGEWSWNRRTDDEKRNGRHLFGFRARGSSGPWASIIAGRCPTPHGSCRNQRHRKRLMLGGVRVTVILVSNRVADPSRDGPIEGGLASALLQAVKTSGATWVGTRIQQANPDRKEPLTALATIGAGTTGRVDLPANLYQQFYRGFANSGLWPVLHSRPDLIRAHDDDYAAYREVNRMMAVAVRTLVHPGARIWSHA